MDLNAAVWKGDPLLPAHLQGITVLGSHIGHEGFVTALLSTKREEHQVEMSDTQSAWLVLLFCGWTCGNYWLRTVSPWLSGTFASEHDAAVLQCLGRFLRVDPAVAHSSVNSATTLPFKFGVFGLRSASRSRDAAHSSSWADCLTTVAARHSTRLGTQPHEASRMCKCACKSNNTFSTQL